MHGRVSRILLAVGVLVVGAAVVVAPGAGSAPPAPNAASGALGGWREYADELERMAEGYKRFGYFEESVGHRIRVGFVGYPPRKVREKISEAPEGSDVRSTRSVWNRRQLDRARDRAIHSDGFEVFEVSDLGRGAGIRVLTSSRKLIRSHRPAHLLGVHVGVVVFRGSVTPDK